MTKFLALINAHKTKVSGYLLIVVGALQTNSSAVQSLISPKQFSLFTVGAGILIAVIGHMNSAKKD